MNTNSLIYYALSFSAVVKAGSFSAAAKHGEISKAQLSRHVTALEGLLGVQLLHRTTRTMALTEQGRQFFEACEAIEERCDEAVHHLKHDFSEMQGTLKITAPIDFGNQFLPPIIDQFCQHYPKMNLTVSLSNTYENLPQRSYDLAIRIANRLPDSTLRMRTLLEFKRIICASPAYFKNRPKPTHPEALSDYHCITSVNHTRATLFPQWQFQIKDRPTNYKLEKFIEIDSLFSQLALIKSGTGIGRMPTYFVKKELETGELIELFPDIEKPNTYIYLLYPDTVSLPQKTRVFIDFMKALKI